jgi:hypothetical protein
LLNADNPSALEYCVGFTKLLLYYLLLVAVVDTPGKLRGFVYYIGGLILVLTTLALLQYHAVINIPALASYAESQWEFFDVGTADGPDILVRLCAAGIYNNPNDLSRILVVGILIALYGLGDRRLTWARLVWAFPLGILAYALALTHSRGGLLGLVGGLFAMMCARLGGRKALQSAVIVVPLLLLLFSGRQTSFSTTSGTGLLRIKLWAEAFFLWQESPLFGIGMVDTNENYPNTHNSFIQAFTALGFFGGTLFLGAFYLGILLPFRSDVPAIGTDQTELRRFRPYLIGIVAGYIVGMFSSSRNSVAPTYMLVGLAAIYMSFAAWYLPASRTRLTGPLVRHVLLVSVLCVGLFYLLVRFSLGTT